ncbi:hypothetical protein [Bradyrhizobium sp. JYMT SZCCT0180]|uniref:hypothetical protein n=1 Tax=Bradyrhizobium sp. JYMT SZCCT0180 TaxID=2807666 RepID=UPI001BA5EABA|nr:hypothetical protein [Bradyrhizobium sp. JYMT SZCCT0180]MBR1213954.1 hypothetical protein [Bradyrhizobium sp. JYMT SZCCT0180]
MAIGMFLKSEWDASSLADPATRYTLQQCCAGARLPYGNAPIPLDTFTRYALSFQRHLVLMVEDALVTVADARNRAADRIIAATAYRFAAAETARSPLVVKAAAGAERHTFQLENTLASQPRDLQLRRSRK